jgi:hypothetical protein
MPSMCRSRVEAGRWRERGKLPRLHSSLGMKTWKLPGQDRHSSSDQRLLGVFVSDGRLGDLAPKPRSLSVSLSLPNSTSSPRAKTRTYAQELTSSSWYLLVSYVQVFCTVQTSDGTQIGMGWMCLSPQPWGEIHIHLLHHAFLPSLSLPLPPSHSSII